MNVTGRGCANVKIITAFNPTFFSTQINLIPWRYTSSEHGGGLEN